MRARVALQAGGIDLFGRGLGRVEDFGYVPAAFNVSAARTVATFAIRTRHAVLVHKLCVRIALEFLGYFFVAGRTNITAYIGAGCSVLCLRSGRLGGLSSK
jgi:hypothetical protein